MAQALTDVGSPAVDAPLVPGRGCTDPVDRGGVA